VTDEISVCSFLSVMAWMRVEVDWVWVGEVGEVRKRCGVVMDAEDGESLRVGGVVLFVLRERERREVILKS